MAAHSDITGHCFVFGDDVNTDVIHPPQFFSLDPEKVKKGLFNGYDPTLQPSLRPGDIFVAGRNFGCGSSRETSIRSLLLNEVGAIVAIDFARIFFRSAINNALPCLAPEDPDALRAIRAGDDATISLEEWTLTTGRTGPIRLRPYGGFARRLLASGGLLNLANTLRPA